MKEREGGKILVVLCLKTYFVSKFHKHCNCEQSERKDVFYS